MLMPWRGLGGVVGSVERVITTEGGGGGAASTHGRWWEEEGVVELHQVR